MSVERAFKEKKTALAKTKRQTVARARRARPRQRNLARRMAPTNPAVSGGWEQISAKPVEATPEKKEEKKEEAWWEKLLNTVSGVAGAAAKILPMFLANCKTVSIHGKKIGGNGVRGNGVPVGMATTTEVTAEVNPIYIPTRDGGLILERSEYLNLTEKVSAYTQGSLIHALDLNPRMAPWLARMANYERYRIKHVLIKWTPGLATTNDGGLVGVFEWDVDNLMKWGTPSSVETALTHQSAMACDLWSPHSWIWTNESQEWLFVADCGHEKRLVDAGRFSLAAGTDIAEDVVCKGFLQVLYCVEFRVAELQMAAGVNDVMSYSPATGFIGDQWYHCLTATDFTGIPSMPLIRAIVPAAEAHTQSVLIQAPRGVWRLVIRGFGSDGLTSNVMNMTAQGDYIQEGGAGEEPDLYTVEGSMYTKASCARAGITVYGGVDYLDASLVFLSSGYTEDMEYVAGSNGIDITFQTDDNAGYGVVAGLEITLECLSPYSGYGGSMQAIIEAAVKRALQVKAPSAKRETVRIYDRRRVIEGEQLKSLKGGASPRCKEIEKGKEKDPATQLKNVDKSSSSTTTRIECGKKR